MSVFFGLLGASGGGQVSGSYAGTINNKTGELQGGQTCGVAANYFGVGASASATLYAAFTPFADSVSDLSGPFGGFVIETEFITLGLTFSSAGPTFTAGIGPTAGASAHGVAGYQSSGQGNSCGCQSK